LHTFSGIKDWKKMRNLSLGSRLAASASVRGDAGPAYVKLGTPAPAQSEEGSDAEELSPRVELPSWSVRQLAKEQLTALGTVLAVSGEILGRLQVDEQLDDVVNALRSARSAAEQAACPLAKRPPGGNGTIQLSQAPAHEPLLERDREAGSPSPSINLPAEKQEEDVDVEHLRRHRTERFFSDVDQRTTQMKKVIETIDAVETQYLSEGWAQWLAQNRMFKNLTYVVVFLSTLWIAVDTDIDKPGAPIQTHVLCNVVEFSVLGFFTFEIFVRFMAFANKNSAFMETHFMFDLSLVVLMLMCNAVQGVEHFMFGISKPAASSGWSAVSNLRFLRLVRLARLGILVRSSPDLVILVHGMTMAIRAAFSTICLLLAIIYVFAVLFTQLLAEKVEIRGYFDNVPQAMLTLLLKVVIEPEPDIMHVLLDIHWGYFVCILIFFTLACLTVLNMLVGVICEVMRDVHRAESASRIIAGVQEEIEKALRQLDVDNDEVITMAEFRSLINNTEVIRVLRDNGINVVGLVECGEYIFLNRESLPINQFMAEVVKFSSSNLTTVKDAVDIRLFIEHELSTIRVFVVHELRKIEESLTMKLDQHVIGPLSHVE
jgi:hypothetical protein